MGKGRGKKIYFFRWRRPVLSDAGVLSFPVEPQRNYDKMYFLPSPLNENGALPYPSTIAGDGSTGHKHF
jgi:hypothetical protein